MGNPEYYFVSEVWTFPCLNPFYANKFRNNKSKRSIVSILTKTPHRFEAGFGLRQ